MMYLSGVRETSHSSKSLSVLVNEDGTVQLSISESAGPCSLGGLGIKLSQEEAKKLYEALKP